MRRYGARLLVTAGLLAWVIVAQAAPPRYQVEVTQTYPHDSRAFTQGLLYAEGSLYESIGLRGQSALRRVAPESGKVLAETKLDKRYFAEGLARVDNRLIQLTWKSGVGFVYDLHTLELLRSFEYDGEGWGLTFDGEHLIMSDGTATLRRLDPHSYKQVGQVQVTLQGQPVNLLNELEIVGGELWANVWRYDAIVRINPASGKVLGVVDAASLREKVTSPHKIDVLNGIAYDAANEQLYVTGKFWPKLFAIKLQPLE